MSRLRRGVAQAGRGCVGDVGVRACEFLCDSPRASQTELQPLRTNRASCGSEPSDRAWHGWTGTLGACADLEVCGPLAFVSSVGDLCAPGCGSGTLDSCRLGGKHESVADASDRCPETLCDGGEQTARG